MEARLTELKQFRQAALLREQELQKELQELVVRIHQHNGAIAAYEEMLKMSGKEEYTKFVEAQA